MTEFEEKVIENLVEIKKQQQQIIETLNKLCTQTRYFNIIKAYMKCPQLTSYLTLKN